jgi:hypothetical protein
MAVPEAQKHSIGIIGGGKSGFAMLRFLSKTNVARVVFVTDPDTSAPAMQEARANNVPAFASIDDALRQPLPEFIFEITTNEETSEKIKQGVKGTPTRIVNQATSRLIVALVEDNRAQIQSDVSVAVRSIKSELMTTLGTSQGLVVKINQMMANMQMLALNASIEASKAGQAGKGFAVVADNMTKSVESVRKLTQEINDVNDTLMVASEQIETVLETLK